MLRPLQQRPAKEQIMSSPNISFDNIPSSIRKPGQYFEFNTKLAVRTLPANAEGADCRPDARQRQPDPLVATSVFSGDEAAVYFGYGSVAHLMVVAAINTYAYLDLTVIGVSDAAPALPQRVR
jgi:phage tail sheath gpL-like